ncbi:MAG: sigma-54-dependent Fis family transcriptional regulator [Planctomycetes bacterium]|nr:sigma-54-dependent Fis family transcriptional regulator [Planctomycetota bacterium]
MACLLVVDDDEGARSAIAALCRALGHETWEAPGAEPGFVSAREHAPEVVLLDLYMPDRDGLSALPDFLALPGAPCVLMLTGMADVPTAVAAMRAGASDFLQKPIHLDALEQALDRVLQNRAVRLERDRLRGELARLRSGPILGESRAIRLVLESVERVAGTPRTTVLITGESGVGKELVARAVHEQSARAEKPFVALNCAALAEGMLEAELFGYEGGAFTGALPKGREGLVAAAEGGSLFLDEIGELPLELQAKLLRVLQERTFRRVGAQTDRRMDVRILASTNRDLSAMVAEGRFREDLFYRLNVMSIRVPPLRERPEDIPVLAAHFLAQFRTEFARGPVALAEETRRKLLSWPWPGNIRELRNALERAVLLSEGAQIQPEHLFPDAPPTPRRPSAASSERSLRGMERSLIEQVLAETGGNRSEAARVLGVNRATLYNKLKSYGLS